MRSKQEDTTVFGYETPPDTPAMHRDVYKWIQSLDLSHSVKNVRRDIANGFVVAELFSRYFPNDVQMHSFANSTSSRFKKDNWDQIGRCASKHGISMPADLVQGTMLGVHGAAVALLEYLYESFTGKKVPRLTMTVSEATTVATNLQTAKPGVSGSTTFAEAKAISSYAKAAQNIEFGAVQTHEVGDAIALRRKLATGA